MASRSRLLALGIATFVVGVVLFFPARVAYNWFAPETARFSGISGSIWRGNAHEADVSGIYLRDISWQARPLALLTGRLNYSVKTNFASGFLEGDVGVGIGGTVVGRDINAAVPLRVLQDMVGVPGLQGSLAAQLSEIEISDGIPVAVQGTINVTRLIVPFVQRDSLGAFKAEFVTSDGDIVASVEDTDAVIDIAGSLRLSADRSYQFLAQLGATANTPAPVREQMQYLGSANERGQHELRLEGTL